MFYYRLLPLLLAGLCSFCTVAQTDRPAVPWVTHRDSLGAVRFELPARADFSCNVVEEPNPVVRLRRQRVCLHSYQSPARDFNVGLTYLTLPYDITPNAVDTVVDDLIRRLQRGRALRVVSRRSGLHDGTPTGRAVLAHANGKRVIVVVYVRGARIYRAVAEFTTHAEALALRFLKSIAWLPTRTVDRPLTDLPGSNVRIAFPQNYVVVDTLEAPEPGGYRRAYFAIDSLSGLNYYVADAYHGPLFSFYADTSFYQNWQAYNEEQYGRMRDTSWRDQPALYREGNLAEGNIRFYQFLHWTGNHEINLFAYGFADSLSRARAWAYFNSYQPQRNYPPDYVRRDRGKEILAALASADSTEQLAAVSQMNHYRFDRRYLPDIYRLIGQAPATHYADAPTVLDWAWLELAYTYDSTTFDFITKDYARADAEGQRYRLRALSNRTDHPPSARFVARELPRWLRAAPEREIDPAFYDRFLYSDSLLVAILPELTPWLADSLLQFSVLSALDHFVYNDETSVKEALLPYRDTFLISLRDTEARYPLPQRPGAISDAALAAYGSYLTILAGLPLTEAGQAYFQQCNTTVFPALARHFCYGLLHAAEQPSPELFNSLRQNLREYYLLAENLATDELLAQQPPAYRQPALLMEGATRLHLEEEVDASFTLEPLPPIERDIGGEACEVRPYYLRFDADPSEKYLVLAARILPTLDYNLEYYINYSETPVTTANEQELYAEVLRKLAGGE